ncbi:uncharacterized protein LOC125028804 isoform X4 [Penaeus chinensis]|uniref:uncharacterized protein LOC125028804 isoform X4 n=1 Tax=Penaeus chinensis TaxID=139456 RepID=UPI001FB8232F|nr:uncharacterized protein LOC125028804 isoform X4 [Penaeus chinensis]XP_047474267.1 uncharacterized protein LOC125028804 isoform X4 [Penaeus chinensis]XP_047474268.1 uncharacterized protein LOC125028804 isoform X4 [Penaeus chinensis]XP_047474270.1 uncharacterized protein LOC125028804 isoform X4 [Penaeus chinensis]
MAAAPRSGATLHIKPPDGFSTRGEASSVSKRWKDWLAAFEIYLDVANVGKDSRKRALLLHTAGLEVQEICRGLFSNSAVATYTDLVTALNKHFIPVGNFRHERFVFNSCAQKQDESVSAYTTRLRKLAATCEFEKIKGEDDIIIDQIIAKCNSKHLRRELLQEPNLTLGRVLEIARVMETTNKTRRVKEQQLCIRCGREGHNPNDKGRCPAADRYCHYCGKKGHFQPMCRLRWVEDDNEDKDYEEENACKSQ